MTKIDHGRLSSDPEGGAAPGRGPVWLVDIAGACIVGANSAGRRLWGLSDAEGGSEAGKQVPPDLQEEDRSPPDRHQEDQHREDWSDEGWPLDKATPALVKLQEQRRLYLKDSMNGIYWSINNQKDEDGFEQTLVFWTARGRLRRRFHGRFVETPRPGLVMLTVSDAVSQPGKSSLESIAAGGRDAGKSNGGPMPDPLMADTGLAPKAGLASKVSPATETGDSAVLREIARRIKTRISPSRYDTDFAVTDSGSEMSPGAALSVAQSGSQDDDASTGLTIGSTAGNLDCPIHGASSNRRHVYSFAAAASEAARDGITAVGSAASRLRASFRATAGRKPELGSPASRAGPEPSAIAPVNTRAGVESADSGRAIGGRIGDDRIGSFQEVASWMPLSSRHTEAVAEETDGLNASQQIEAERVRPEPVDSVHADSTQAGSTQAGSTQAGSTQAGSTQAGSTLAKPAKARSTKGETAQVGSKQHESEQRSLDPVQQDIEMSELTARLAHELRTPLSAIYTAAEILESERFGPIGNERYKGYAKDIHQSAAHALSVVNAALDPDNMSGRELQLEPTQVNLATLIHGAVSSVTPLAEKAGLEVVTRIDSDLPHVIADARCIKQMLLNLLTNAIKFTKSGGKIEISTAYELDGPVRFEVCDSGPGMSDAQIAGIPGVRANSVDALHATKSSAIAGELSCGAAISDHYFKAGPTSRSNDALRDNDSSKGLGYGLPLTSSMAKANGATLELGRSAAGGLSAAIVFARDRVAPIW